MTNKDHASLVFESAEKKKDFINAGRQRQAKKAKKVANETNFEMMAM